jgi:3-hydroxy-9,10-secoandrosta-1,3,5(10)-triene-9,17-dione monooxygenase reductase component
MRPVGPERFRAVMGRFPTGVTVVTAMGPDGPVGMTANAVTSLSLDPLLLLVCFDRGARTLPVVQEAGRFGVNVLARGQEDLARRFASKAPEEEKFAGVPYTVDAGVPVLEGAHAWLGCDLERLVPGGDHTIGIGAVHAAEVGVGEALAWYAGSYGTFSR